MKLMASLAPARAEVEAGAVAKEVEDGAGAVAKADNSVKPCGKWSRKCLSMHSLCFYIQTSVKLYGTWSNLYNQELIISEVLPWPQYLFYLTITPPPLPTVFMSDLLSALIFGSIYHFLFPFDHSLIKHWLPPAFWWVLTVLLLE